MQSQYDTRPFYFRGISNGDTELLAGRIPAIHLAALLSSYSMLLDTGLEKLSVLYPSESIVRIELKMDSGSVIFAKEIRLNRDYTYSVTNVMIPMLHPMSTSECTELRWSLRVKNGN